MKARLAVVVLVPLLLVGVGCRERDRGADTGDVDGTGATGGTGDAIVPVAGRTVDGRLTTADGRERTYHLYVPGGLVDASSDAPVSTVPLLIALHGGTGSGTQFRRNSGFDALADEHGFLVVYPDGVGVGPSEKLRTWNGGYCCGPAARDDVDDVGFVRDLIDVLEAKYPIDPRRVFAAGHSNGGILSYRLACELSDRIVAVALQAGSLGVDECAPEHAVSLLHLHGAADTNHPIDGGKGTTGISGVDFHSARTSVRDFAAADGCPAEPTVETDPTNPDVTVSTWSPCNDGSEVEFVEVAGARHAWMGHASEVPRLTGEAYEGLDASVVVVEFLLAHPRRD